MFNGICNGDCKRCGGVLATCLSALVAYAPALRAQQDSRKPVTLAAIVDGMEARQKRAASVRIRWTRSDRYSAGAVQGLPKASSFTFPCELLLKGKVSMRYSRKILSFVGGKVHLVDHVSCFAGKESRTLSGEKQPWGRIHEEKVNTDADVPSLLPLMLYVRPLEKLDRKALRFSDVRKTIGGHVCVAIDDGRFRLYLDGDRAFVPVAFERYVKDGTLFLDGSLEYRKQDESTWVPTAFQFTRYSNGRGVAERDRGDRAEVETGAPLKDSDFSLTFGPGTVVWDARTQEEYVIREDGSKVPVEWQRGTAVPKAAVK
jgi:hypothetical protein